MAGPVHLDDSSDDDQPLSLADLLSTRSAASQPQPQSQSQPQSQAYSYSYSSTSSPPAQSPPTPAGATQPPGRHIGNAPRPNITQSSNNDEGHNLRPTRLSFYRSIQQQASQLSLKSLRRPSGPSFPNTRQSNYQTDLERSGGTGTISDPTLVTTPSERSRLFGPLSFARNPRRQGYGALRLEDSDSEGGDEDSLLDRLQDHDGRATTRGGGLLPPRNWRKTSGSGEGRIKGTGGSRKKGGWLGKRPLLRAGLQVTGIFILSTLILGGTLWLALPTLDDEDRAKLRIPKSFEQLQDLNALLKKYRSIYPYRIVLCFCSVYLFLQAFSLPGSMYLSILGGAVWGVARALPLCCACVATGASLCYALSAAFGPVLLTMPKWRARLEKWSRKVESQRANLLSFLIIIRISPLPPHWVVNIVCPHIGIGLVPFWISTFLGIVGVTVIHTTIGGGLDEMTSAKDFRLFSVKNGLILSGIVVAVLIPVGIRYYFRDSIAAAAAVEEDLPDGNDIEEGEVDGNGTRDRIAGRSRSRDGDGLIFLDDEDEYEYDYSGQQSDRADAGSDIFLAGGRGGGGGGGRGANGTALFSNSSSSSELGAEVDSDRDELPTTGSRIR